MKIAKEISTEAKINLVTSHYSKPEIIAQCIDFNFGLIPKALAGKIPMRVSAPSPVLNTTSSPSEPLVILLDDDLLVIEIWQMAAKDKNINFQTFTEAKELLAILNTLNKDTSFYIDSNLANGVKGEDIAKQIFDKGFKNITLATGSPKEDFTHLDHLIGVIGKEPPF